jgi:hypothetical protein
MQLTLFAEDALAKVSQSPDYEKDWMIRVATSPLPILRLLTDTVHGGSFMRMSPASCQIKQGRLEPSLEGWQNSGMGSPTGFLTLNLPEWNHTLTQSRNVDADCSLSGTVASLSEILETGELPQRYYLSAKACKGILRRAEKRGKELPPALARALEAVAGSGCQTKNCSVKTGGGLTWTPEIPPTVQQGPPFSRTGNDRVERDAIVATWPSEVAPTLNAAFGDKQGLEDQHINGGGGIVRARQ